MRILLVLSFLMLGACVTERGGRNCGEIKRSTAPCPSGTKVRCGNDSGGCPRCQCVRG